MQIKYWEKLALSIGLLAIVQGAVAADLTTYNFRQCTNYRQSAMAQMPADEIRVSVAANFESAKAGMDAFAERQPAFVWAMEARWACSAALGYLNGGYVDKESVQKCDCFHQIYQSFR